MTLLVRSRHLQQHVGLLGTGTGFTSLPARSYLPAVARVMPTLS